MQRCGDCCGARRLLGGHRFAAPAPASVSVSVSASAQSVDAQRAHLERVLAATTTVLFLASVSYVAISTLYGCILAGSSRRRGAGADGDDSGAPAPSAAAREGTKRALEGTPVQVVVVGEEEADCAVCLAEYAGGDEVRVLPACRHGFHKECVDRWLLTRAPTCPVCRAPVDPVDEPDDKVGCATGGYTDAGRDGIGVAGSRVLPPMWP